MSIGERLRHEARQIGFVALYFFICFVVFLTLKKLLVYDYHASVYVLHAAVIGTLLVAKVVVILEKTPLGNYFRGGRLITHIVWRSLVYTVVIFVATLVEQLVEVYLDKGSVMSAAREFTTRKDFDHFLAFNLSAALSFLLYNTARELDRRLGPGSVRRLLLAPEAAP